jgi:hypothetical protein
MLLASRHIYGKSHIDMIVETFLDIPESLDLSSYLAALFFKE